MPIQWEEIARTIVEAVGRRQPLRTTVQELMGDLQRTKETFDRQTASGHGRILKGDTRAVLQNGIYARKLYVKLSSLRRSDTHNAALMTAARADPHILGNDSTDQFLDRLQGDLTKYVALIDRFGQAAERQGDMLFDSEEARQWSRLFNLDEPTRRLLAIRTLITHEIPHIYERHFGRRFGISRHETKGVVGPAVRFAVAVLHAFEVRNDRDRPFSAETLAAYWYSAQTRGDRLS